YPKEVGFHKGSESSPRRSALATKDSLHSRVRSPWVFLLAAAIVGFGLGRAIVQFLPRGITPPELPKAAENRPPEIQPSIQVLRLNALRVGSSLKLSWTPTPSALSRAILLIQDGTEQSETVLTQAEFNSGEFVYRTNSSEVTFQMDVYH